MWNKIIQCAKSLLLSQSKEVITSSSETKQIIDLKLIKDEWIYQFEDYLQCTLTLDFMIEYYHFEYEWKDCNEELWQS